MKIGFVGAGKVGFTLGRYMTEHNVCVSGYYSQHEESALKASEFTHTQCFQTAGDLIHASDALFLTVPDGAVSRVWNALKAYQLQGKCICHCSGSLSSAVFSDIDRTGASGYSIHPLFAVHDKLQSYQEFSNAFITIEGMPAYLSYWERLFSGMGNPVRIIRAQDKVLYHAGAVFASNLVTGLYECGVRLLGQCGFTAEEAGRALAPLFLNNAANIANSGTADALTGPVERGDLTTVRNHLRLLDREEKEIYVRLSEILVDIARRKHPDRNFGDVSRMLEMARVGKEWEK